MMTKKRPRLNWQVQPRLNARLQLALNGGGWWCHGCQSETERLESDQGEPASCGSCGSHRIEYQQPITDKNLCSKNS